MKNLKEFKSYIKRNIPKKGLIEIIEEVFVELDENKSMYNELIMILGKIVTVNKRLDLGIITREYHDLVENEARHSFIKFIDRLKDEDVKLEEVEEKSERKSFNIIKDFSEKIFLLNEEKENIKKNKPFVKLDSPELRTNEIINEFRNLLESDKDLNDVELWSRSFLSILAINENEPISNNSKDRVYLENLLLEKKLLIELLERGCHLNCIISPANINYLRHTSIDRAICRTENLLKFLEKESTALRRIDWVVSEHGHKNVYIIGKSILYEGYKKNPKPGYDLTMKITDQELIEANIEMYSDFFTSLRAVTLFKWGKGDPPSENENDLLRISTINCLKDSLDYLNKFKHGKENS